MTGRDDFDDREALAAEYALGVLEGSERRAAEALLGTDATFAAAVERWRTQLAPVVETVAAVAPPADLWARIEAEVAPAAARDRTAAPAAERASMWSSLFFWRGLSFASMAAAAAMAALVLSTPQPVAGPAEPGFQQAVADAGMMAAPVMLQDSGSALVAAAYDPDGSSVLVTPTSRIPLQQSQSMELWIIVGDKAPRSLGVVDPENPSYHRMPADVRAQLAAGAALAISIEPSGGSPTGAPTGPVVASGKLTAI